MSAPVRIAVVGAGLIGTRHIDAIAASDEAATLHSIVDPELAAAAIATQYAVPHWETLEAQIKHFSDVIRREAEPLVPARSGWLALRAVQAVKRAAETGMPIDFATGIMND